MHRQRAEKADHEPKCAEKAELISPVEYVEVAEPEYKYGEEAFEEHQKAVKKAIIEDSVERNTCKKQKEPINAYSFELKLYLIQRNLI